LLLIISFIGWGKAIGKRLAPGIPHGWAEAAAVGMAAVIGLSGILNLLQLISKAFLFVLVLSGIAFAVVLAFREYQSKRKEPAISAKSHRWFDVAIYSIITVVSLYIFCGTLAMYGFDAMSGGFNGHDDTHAYLAFPYQMLEHGGLFEDPFNERRMVSSLGGQSFLHALVLTVLPVESLKIADPGIPWVLCIAIATMEIRRRGSPWQYAVAPLIVMFLARVPIVNLTSMGTSLYIFVAIPLIIMRWTSIKKPISAGLLVGIMGAAVISLKSTNLPSLLVFAAVYYGWRLLFGNERKAAWTEMKVAAAGSVALLAPSMLSMYRSSGTLFYPILGKGWGGGGSQIAENNQSILKMLSNFAQGSDIIVLCLIGGLCSVVLPIRSKEWALTTGTWLSALVSAFSLYYVFQGHHPRYHYAVITAAIVVCSLYAVGETLIRREGVAALGLFYSLSASPDLKYKPLEPNWEHVKTALKEVPGLRSLRGPYLKMQEKAPPGAKILARLDIPMMFDFARNPIWMVDVPCGVGARPGMNCKSSVGSIVKYLQKHDVEYVAYSYKNEAHYSRLGFSHYLTSSDPLMRLQAKRVFRFTDILEELGRCSERVYDDGERWMVRLDPGDCSK
jgi:hypothetical protein